MLLVIASCTKQKKTPHVVPLDQETLAQKKADGSMSVYAAKKLSPSAEFTEKIYTFDPVVDGTVMVHDFVVLNNGAETLEIRDVVTNCSCATADFPREINPGEGGAISITLDTSGYGGTELERKMFVSTNDPEHKIYYFYMTGTVIDFADVQPKKMLVLRGKVGEDIQSVVTITPKQDYPFTILKYLIDDHLNDHVKVTLEEKDGAYIFTATNIQKTPGKYKGIIYIYMDSQVKPEFKMYIKGYIN